MSGTPYIRFFGDDWLSGTSELSLDERGALITITALTASTGLAPEYDLDRISRRLGCTKGRAKKVINQLIELGKIHVSDGRLISERALKETKISQKNSQKQSENVSKRWAKKQEKPNEINGCADTVVIPPKYQPEPEPEPLVKEDTNVSSKRRRGSRLQGNWILPREYGEWALSEGYPETAIRSEAEKFRDYWISLPGQKGSKLDWLATWRNWMRNSSTPKLKSINGGGYEPASKSISKQNAFIAGAAGTP